MPASKSIVMLANHNAIALLSLWFPAGRLSGDNFRVGDIHGNPGDSLSIDISTCRWNDFAVPHLRGSNLISLCAAIHGISYREALRRVRQELTSLGCVGADRVSNKRGSGKAKPVLEAIVPVPANAPRPSLEVGMPHPWKSGFTLVAVWEYRNSQGQLLHYTARFDNSTEITSKGKPAKEVLPYSYFGDSWRFKGTGLASNGLYGEERLSQRPDCPVLLVEGEKTCDAAATIFPDFVTVTWLGGLGQLSKANFSQLKDRQVFYWPDNDEGGKGSAKQVAELCRSAGVAELQIVSIPIGLPTGWDLADEPPASIDLAELLSAAGKIDLTALPPFTTLTEDQLVARLIYNSGTHQFLDQESGVRHSASQLDALFRHYRRRISGVLLENPAFRRVVAITYEPGNRNLILMDTFGTTKINTWRSSTVRPELGDALPFELHLRYLCSSEDEFRIFADWLAFLVQSPGEKASYASVIIGRQGTGKTAVTQILSRLLGEHNTRVVSGAEIRSDFNSWLSEVQLVIVEEIMTLGRLEIMNTLKPFITERRIIVNEKHLPRYEIDNKANFVFLSNHFDALRLEEGDRRYFVVSSQEQPREPEYYTMFFRWVEANLGVILGWLLSRDLSTFNPKDRAPTTPGKIAMIEASRDEREVLLAELLSNHEPPFEFDLVEIAKVHRALAEIHRGSHGLAFSRPKLQTLLKQHGAVNLGQKKAIVRGKEVRVSLWAVRNASSYINLSGQQLIETYQRFEREF